MAEPPSLGDLNPFKNFTLSGGTMGNVILVIIIAVLIIVLVGGLIWMILNKKKYKYIIPLYALVGNVPTRVATFRAKVIPISRAGDFLWFVRGAKKFIPPATIQSAKNEYWHWLREDGEWINFSLGDLDETQKKAGVKYIHQDMRSQRIATSNLLEQRLMNKSFWEKYGLVIGYVIFFLVITIAMIIIFYQYDQIAEKTDSILGKAIDVLDRAGCGGSGLVPAIFLPFIYLGFKGGLKCLFLAKS